jgi:predicted metallo-beta-lactamase superfamily hydrolase
MDIIPIAEESLGVRSMAMFVKTRDLSILLDPGISLSPNRFGLPPHPKELERVRALRSVLEGYAERADYVFISHYHRDHFTVPYASIYMGTEEDSYRRIYMGKTILMKSPNDINWSQKRRYYGLKKAIENIAKELIFADGKELMVGSTRLTISPPLFHGEENAKTGKVIAITIEENSERLTFMPDVEGPVTELAVNYIMNMKSQTLIVGGPPLYLKGRIYKDDYFNKALDNLINIIKAGFLRKLVIAHHTLRDLNWRDDVKTLFNEADKYGVSVLSYANLLNRNDELLEAMRKELYRVEPPPKDYLEQFKRVKERDED